MKKLTLLLTGLLFLLTLSLLQAEDKKSEQEMMQKPKFSPELAKLNFLVGKFDLDVMMYKNPMGEGGPGKGKSNNYWGLDSMFLMIEHEDTSPMGHYLGHGLLTYDMTKGKYKLWWFTNWGEASDYEGDFIGDTLNLETSMDMPDGSKFALKLMYHPEGKKVKFRIFADEGKGYNLLMDASYNPMKGGKK